MNSKNKTNIKKAIYEFMSPLVYWTTDEKEAKKLERLGYKKIGKGELEIPEDEEKLLKNGWIKQSDGLFRRKIKKGSAAFDNADFQFKKLAQEKRTRKHKKRLALLKKKESIKLK